MKTKHVVVEPYNPLWASAFQDIKKELASVLKDRCIAIEHVGSTSVVGLSAKPVIDIDVVIDHTFDEVKKGLESIGYTHEGDLGITGREAFKYKHKHHLMKHHLYVCEKDALELRKHLTLRDHLRTHPEDLKFYGTLKKKLAHKFPYDIDSYIEGKSEFVLSIYKRYHLI